MSTKSITFAVLKRTPGALWWAALGSVLVLVTLGVIYLERRADLDPWHTVKLEQEFTARSRVSSFTEYLELEERLFAELDEKVYAQSPNAGRHAIHRFAAGSPSDPRGYERNWNRSYELTVEQPKSGVLLLHGMSDAPYSLRSVGLRLREEGHHVVGLRLPGHGTHPGGLVSVRWQDMAAAVELAMRHLQEVVGDGPLYIVGYSNGGALAVNYALEVLDGAQLPAVRGMVLISPSIGVTSAAAFAVWQARLGTLLGLDKLAWNSIKPEYDPYKYGSFAVNAGDQVHRLTQVIQSRLSELEATPELETFPPVLALQSIVDSTVSTPALIEGLFERLPVGDHELVLFDVNRRGELEQFLAEDHRPAIDELLGVTEPHFDLNLLRNVSEDTSSVLVVQRNVGESKSRVIDTELEWPKGIFSLSHVALPISPDDPLYGRYDTEEPGLQLGELALRGENGALKIGAADMLRLRWNPFYSLLEERVVGFVEH